MSAVESLPVPEHTQRRLEAWDSINPSQYPNLPDPNANFDPNVDDGYDPRTHVTAIAKAQVQPYVRAVVEYDNNRATNQLGAALARGQFTGDAEAAARDLLRARTIEQTDRGSRALALGAKIMQIANANPADVTAERVLDPVRAEEMAYAMAPDREAVAAVQNASKPWYRRQAKHEQMVAASVAKHTQQAEQAGEAASEAYHQGLINDARKF